MSIRIINRFYINDHDLSNPKWLLNNIGDKVECRLDFEVSTYALASTDNPIIFAPTNGYLENDHVVSDLDVFAEFEVGDTVEVSGVAGGNFNATIIDKISDGDIRLDTLNGVSGSGTSALIFNTTPIKAIDFLYNFVENDIESYYNNAVDGSLQKYSIPLKLAGDTTLTPMVAQGVQSWQMGTVSIRGNGINSTAGEYRSFYRIEIKTHLNPLTTIKPSYFNNDKCLKHIFKINTYYDFTNPNRFITAESNEVLGNTGWFNETFNTGISNYNSSNLLFKRTNNTIIPSLELNNTLQKFEYIINSENATFTSGGIVVSVGFFKDVNSNVEIVSTQNQYQNYVFDYLKGATTILTPPPMIGENIAILKNVTINYISSTQIKVIGNVQLTQQYIDTFKLSETPKFCIYSGVQGATALTPNTDRESVLVCANEFHIDNTDPNLLINTTKFLKHYENDVNTEGSTIINVFPEDEVVAYNLFYIDKQGRGADAIKIKDITCQIIAKNTSTLDKFNLQQYTYNLSTANIINGNQFIDLTINTPLHIPSNEIRKAIKIKRRTDLDTIDKFYYEVSYPFIIRWEYFKELQAINGAFFDNTKPFNGFNHFWHQYTTQPNWGLYFDFTVTVLKNNIPLKFTKQSLIESNDWNSNTNFVPNEIIAYDSDTLLTLVNGFDKSIQGYKQSKIVVSSNKIIGAVDLPNTIVVIRIEAHKIGGIEGSTRISTSNAKDFDTIFVDINSLGTATLYTSGNTIYAECLIDNTKLPNNNVFKISARVYEKPVNGGKIFQDGNKFIFQNGDRYIYQNQ